MREKIKLYVSKNEDISEDLLFADDTTLISYFNETECEVITEDCELCLLEKILNQQLAEKEVKIEVLERDVENLHRTLQEANEELAEKDNDHDMLIDDFQQERENLCNQIKTESDARKRAVEKFKQIRKQVCNKIKKLLQMDYNDKYGYVHISCIKTILDQIEEGE